MKKTKTCIKERTVGGIILYQVARAANKGLFEAMSRKREKYPMRYQEKCVCGKGNCHCKGPEEDAGSTCSDPNKEASGREA